MRDELLKIIKELAKEQKIVLDLTPEGLNKNFNELDINSLDVLNLIAIIEEKIGYQLPDEELTKIKTVNELIDSFISNKK